MNLPNLGVATHDNSMERAIGPAQSLGRQPKPWQLLAARLSLDQPIDYNLAIIDVLESTKSVLSAVSMAEVVVLIGRLIASSQDNLDKACDIVFDSIDHFGHLPFEWSSVFASLPEIDGDLKISQLEYFAFIVELHRRFYPDIPFPAEQIGFSNRWSNRLSHAFFIKWLVVSATIPSSPSYLRVPLLKYLRGIELTTDVELCELFPPGFITHSTATIWSNSILLGALLELIESDRSGGDQPASNTPGAQRDDIQAAGLSFELLKGPTINSPELVLATLIRATHIVPGLARPLATDCLDNLWKRSQQKVTCGDVHAFIRWLAKLNPVRFSSVAIGALYTRTPGKILEVVSALDSSMILAIVDGPPAPFKFHIAHVAWSPEFDTPKWLEQRLRTDASGEVAKEFILFLILSLCPLEALQQRLPLGTSHPMRRLLIAPHELWLYLATIVAQCGKPELIPAMDLDQTAEQILAKPHGLLDAELGKLKESCARLLPQLAGFIHLLQPTRNTTDAPSQVSLTASDAPRSSELNATLPSSSGPTQQIMDEPSMVSSEDCSCEQEVHRYFAMLYTDEITPDGMLSIMKKFSSSLPGSHDYQVFNHMIKLLFHECRFFPKYPFTELAVTAELMGKMIRDEVLVGHAPYGSGHLLAIRCVTEALRKGETTKMFRFGVTALQQFIDSRTIVCNPDFLVALSTTLPDVRKHFPQYVEYSDKCLACIPADLRRSHHLDHETVNSLSFPPPPVIIPHPEFTLSSRRVGNQTAGPAVATSDNGLAPTAAPTQTMTSTDGLPPQRPLILNGKPISLGAFSLGSVERLLSSDPHLTAGVVQPPQWVQDRVFQVFNSLVQTTIGQKGEDLRAFLQPEWFSWLALYIVKSRVTKETNFHQVFVQLLERLSWPKLMDIVVSVTYESIHCLLSYVDAAKESSSYRTVLKNLGSWLGTLTLARNLPLRSKAIDLKALLFDGYENGRLKALLPFCCKILEGVGQSRTLRPPNPWTVAIFSLLCEIHALPGLITALVFEIEVLFKDLHLQVSDYKGRSSYLLRRAPPPFNSLDFTKRNIPPPVTSLVRPTSSTHLLSDSVIGNAANLMMSINGPQTAPSSTYQMGPAGQRSSAELFAPSAASKLSDPSIIVAASARAASQPSPVGPTTGGVASLAASTAGPRGLAAQSDCLSDIQAALAADASLVKKFAPAQTIETARTTQPSVPAEPTSSLLAGLMQSVVISPALVLFQLKPTLKSVVPRAIGRAIKEIVQIVAERSVTISCVATKELVCRDFAAEASESLLRRASHLMVASLAGSLALVTCREPLRAAMCQHLRTLLLATSDKLGEDQRLVDQVVGVIAADNIGLSCSLVEQSVIQGALQEIEVTLQKSIGLRRQFEPGSGQVFVDTEYIGNQRWLSVLPEALRPRAALTSDQLQVYKDFLTFGPLQKMQQSSGPTSLSSDAPPTTAGQQQQPAGGVLSPIASEPSTILPSPVGDGEATVLMRAEASLSRIKDIVHEVAFCYPVLFVRVTSETKFSSPLGALPPPLDVPPCVNPSLSILCRLPSCHELFSAVLGLAACCSTAENIESAVLSIAQRVLKMITDAGALYHQHLLVKGTVDVAGLYLEVFLAILDQLAHIPKFPRQQFDAELSSWLPQILSDRRCAADVMTGLFRYNLISFAQADKLLVEQCLCSVEKCETMVLENVLKLLHRIAVQSKIKIDNLPAVLDAVRGCRELTQRMPVSTDVTDTFSSSSSLSSLLCGVVIILDGQTPQYFVEARQTVLDEINAAFEGAGVVECTNNQPAGEMITQLTQLIDNYATLGSSISYVRKLPAPVLLSSDHQQQFASLFDQWSVCALVVGSDRRSKVWAEFFQTLSKLRLLQMDEDTDRFFSGCVDRACELAHELPERDNQKNDDSSDDPPVDEPPSYECSGPNMKPIDALAKMIVAMMRLIDPSQISPVLILQRALSVISRSMHRDAEVSPTSLPQKLYYRLLLSLMWEVGQPGRGLDTYAVPCLLYFSSTYQILNPCECPAFVFCWLELISHRVFMPKLLRHLRGWPHYHRLLISLFRFMFPFLHYGKLTPSIQALYKGMLRLLLVLLHDFPEFLCEYCVDLCGALPVNSIQLRNLVLSAFPRNIKLPDPFVPNLKIQDIPEMRRVPQSATISNVFLARTGVHQLLEKCRVSISPENIDAIVSHLRIPVTDRNVLSPNVHYNVQLMNAILLHFAVHASGDDLPFTIGSSSVASLSNVPVEYKTYLHLIFSLDMEGRHLFLSCISNHLRYPNSHTYYFSGLLLWIFYESKNTASIQEQITRVLLERLIAHRPHPWGVIVTFIDLIKNPIFDFWNLQFLHSAPQVQQLFQFVAQTCFVQEPQLLMQLEKMKQQSTHE